MAFAPVFQRPFAPTFDRHARTSNGLLNNLVAYWPLNEAAGANNALDLHSNGLTLTQVSSPGADTGMVYSTARTFDGGANYFTRNSETLTQTGDVDFTIAAWVYRANTPADTFSIVSKDDVNSREYFMYIGSSNTAIFQVYRAGPISKIAIAGTVPLNTWTFLVGWHSAANDIVGAQCNADAAVENATGGALQAATNMPFRIGRMAGNDFPRYFNGRIGPVAMWKSAVGGGGVLTAAQRTALYNGGAGLTYAQFTT